MSKFRFFIPAIIWLIVIGIASGYPGNTIPKVPVWQADKIVHITIYAILSFFLLIAFRKQYLIKNTRLRISLFIILFSISYGGLMEILQHYIFINRSGNWYDFLANGLGAILGVILFPILIKLPLLNRIIK